MKTEKLKVVNFCPELLFKKVSSSKKFCISFTSVYLQNFFIHFLQRKLENLCIINSSEIDESWIESHSVQADLFYEEKIFVVINSSKLQVGHVNRLVSEVDERIIFCDFQKVDKLLTVIGGVDFVEPKFWEFGDFSRALSQIFNLSLGRKEFEAIELHIEKSIDSYWKLFLKLSQFDERSLSEGLFLEVLSENRYFDQFKFSNLLNSKEKRMLISSLLEVKNFQELESICSFLITHGLKILDPSTIKKKSKLSKFDQSIIRANSVWKENELMSFLGVLKKVSYFCRSKKKEAFIELMKASLA